MNSIRLYVVYDKIQDVCTKISYANTDIEAFTATQSIINDKIKANDSYKPEDFELVFVGTFDLSSGLITPDYQIITDVIVSDFKSDIQRKRESFLQEVNKKFGRS